MGLCRVYGVPLCQGSMGVELYGVYTVPRGGGSRVGSIECPVCRECGDGAVWGLQGARRWGELCGVCRAPRSREHGSRVV